MKYCCPFHVIDMPIDKDGAGPAEGDAVVRTVYEVWDAANVTVAECAAPDIADFITNLLNSHPKPHSKDCNCIGFQHYEPCSSYIPCH